MATPDIRIEHIARLLTKLVAENEYCSEDKFYGGKWYQYPLHEFHTEDEIYYGFMKALEKLEDA